MIRTRPAVATISAIKCGPVMRCCVLIETAWPPNMTLASMAPAMHPVNWAGTSRSGTPGHPTESSVDEGHHRVEMRSAHRPEHQDDGEQSERRGAGVLGQL